MQRRSLLKSILALSAAPAFVRADSLMKIIVPPSFVLYGDGIHDDTAAMQALIRGDMVRNAKGLILHNSGTVVIPPASYIVSSTITFTRPTEMRGSYIAVKHKGHAFLLDWQRGQSSVMLGNVIAMQGGGFIAAAR